MYGPDERYYTLTKVGELVDAQTIDDFGVVVSSVYRYDGKYHFIKRHRLTDYWFDIEDKETLKTIKEYHRLRIRRKLEYGAPPNSEVSGLSKLMWRLYAVLDRRAFCRVKDEVEHETDIYEDLTDRT